MRDIKFRAYRKSTQNVCDVLSIDFEKGWVLLDDGDEEDISTVELMQYTGLHDKNGKGIYEGDILKVTLLLEDNNGGSYMAPVKWFGNPDEYPDNNYPAFDLDNIPAPWIYDANALSTIMNSGHETCEVVGNVYENKDLLEKKF